MKLKQDNEEWHKLVGDAVNACPVHQSTPTLRLILVGLMLPWTTQLFKALGRLAAKWE